MRSIHLTTNGMADCIMVIKTIQKRRFITTLLFRDTTCVSVKTARSIISCLNRTMLHNAMNISQMRFAVSRMAARPLVACYQRDARMLFLRNSRLTEKD